METRAVEPYRRAPTIFVLGPSSRARVGAAQAGQKASRDPITSRVPPRWGPGEWRPPPHDSETACAVKKHITTHTHHATTPRSTHPEMHDFKAIRPHHQARGQHAATNTTPLPHSTSQHHGHTTTPRSTRHTDAKIQGQKGHITTDTRAARRGPQSTTPAKHKEGGQS